MKKIRNCYIYIIIDYIGLSKSFSIFKNLSNKKLYNLVYSEMRKLQEPKFYPMTESTRLKFPFTLIGEIKRISENLNETLSTSFLVQPNIILCSLPLQDEIKINELVFFYQDKTFKIIDIIFEDSKDKTVLMRIDDKLEIMNIEKTYFEFIGKNKYKHLERIEYIRLNLFSIINDKYEFSNSCFMEIELCIKNTLNKRVQKIELINGRKIDSGAPIFLKIEKGLFLYGIYINTGIIGKGFCLRFFDFFFSKLTCNAQIDPFSLYHDYLAINSLEIEAQYQIKELAYYLSNYSFLKIDSLSFKKCSFINNKYLKFPKNCNFDINHLVISQCELGISFLKELFKCFSKNFTNLVNLYIIGNNFKEDIENVINLALNTVLLKSIKLFKFTNNNLNKSALNSLSGFIAKMVNLEHLDLSKNKINDDSIENLSFSLKKLNYLKTLVLADNNIDDLGSDILSKNVSVALLDLSNNCISLNGEKNIQNNMPKTSKILFSGKSMYGLNDGTEIKIIKRNINKDNQCCISY